jgi:SAM-dependent methyltransferase
MSGKEPGRECPVCGHGGEAELLHTQEFVLPSDHVLPEKQDIVVCAACGCVYVDADATQATFDKYYAQMSKYEGGYADDAEMFSSRAAWIGEVLGAERPAVIDVGCGNGRLLLDLRDVGFDDLFALDPSADCIRAIESEGISGFVGSLFSVPTTRTFGALILSGVLEHLWDVSGAMRAVDSMLSQDGYLFVFAPDASRYAEYDFAPYDYFNIEHVNHFDEVALIDLGLLHGFEVVELRKTEIALGHVQQPVIHCAYRRGARGRSGWTSHAARAVQRYVELTGDRGETTAIRDLLRSDARVVVWGAGNYASRLLATSDLGGCNIVCFVDNDRHKQGTLVAGRPVMAPGHIASLAEDVKVLVTAAVFRDEIVAEAKAMGLKNEVVVLDER